MSKLCLVVFCAGVLFFGSPRSVFSQSSIASVMHPIPEWEDEFYHQHYFTIGAGLVVADLPVPQGFYFEYATPDGKNIDGIHHMDLSSGGAGPGFTAQSGLDVALGNGYKVTADANILFERVSHSEGQPASSGTINAKNYSMGLWYAGLQAMIRKGLNFRSTYITAGMSAAYYITDIFSGQYIIPGITYDIKEQVSHYTFNPQQYYALFGVGFLPSHSDERLFSAEFLARIPLSNLFSGRTFDDYAASGVKPVKLWSVSLTLRMELPFGHPISRNEDRSVDAVVQSDSVMISRVLGR